MKNIQPTKIFFPNLDGLRFIAFFAVFFHHSFLVSCFSSEAATPIYQFLFALKMNGAKGVNLFFVLSGFLITYLLLSEKAKYNTIKIPNFYMRRLLRIWPLYFMMVFIGFILFPYFKTISGGIPGETHTAGYYMLFVSNFQMIQKGFADSSILNVLWSVGVEEQFYIVWPLLLFVVPKKYFVKALIFLLIATLVFRFFHRNNSAVIYYHTFSVIGDMVIGGITAWLAFYSTRFMNWISGLSQKSIVFVYLAGTLLLIFNYKIFVNGNLLVFERIFYALFFAFIIAEQNFAVNSFYKLSKFRTLSLLGNYTYGLYCLHTVALLGTHIFSDKVLHLQNNIFTMTIDFTFGLGLSILMAYLSYQYFETPFLKLKSKFSYFSK